MNPEHRSYIGVLPVLDGKALRLRGSGTQPLLATLQEMAHVARPRGECQKNQSGMRAADPVAITAIANPGPWDHVAAP